MDQGHCWEFTGYGSLYQCYWCKETTVESETIGCKKPCPKAAEGNAKLEEERINREKAEYRQMVEERKRFEYLKFKYGESGD